MRVVQLADIEAAARVVARCHSRARASCAAQLIAKADIADKYRKRSGKPHPLFGTGH